MALPKIESPTFMLEVPSTKQTLRYRPFTVKEEKILLVALQAEDIKETEHAIKQVLNNCIVDDVDLDDLATYDIEYLFLQLRAKSVTNIIEFSIEDDGEYYKTEINLDEVKVYFDPTHINSIELNEEITLIMRDPTYSIVAKLENRSDTDMLFEAVSGCIDKVLVGDDQVITMKDYTRDEQKEFIDSFSSKNMRQIEKYFDTLPKLSHTVQYVTNDGETKEREISGLQSFFI
jgi:hypothetical protein